MDKLNRLDRKFNKAIKNRKQYKNDDEVNKCLIKLLSKKTQYDIKMGNKERGLKNLKKLTKFVKDPEFKKDPSKFEKFLRSMLPEDYRYWDLGTMKQNIKNGIQFYGDVGTTVIGRDLPDGKGGIKFANDPILAGLSGISYYSDKFSSKVASKLLSKAQNFKTLMRAVDYLDPISLKQLGSSYPMIFGALGATKAKRFFKKVKNTLKKFSPTSTPITKPSKIRPQESFMRTYNLKQKSYTEATKDLLKNKHAIGTIDNITLNNIDKKYNKLIKTRKNDKYLNKNHYYERNKDDEGLLKAKSQQKKTNDNILDILIKKSIYDIKYGNEQRGLKNLNRIIGLKLRDKSDLGDNLELLNAYLNVMPTELKSLHSKQPKNYKDVLKQKKYKINKTIWSKKKPILSKLFAKVKDLFKSKYEDNPELAVVAENVYKKFLSEAFNIISNSKNTYTKVEVFNLANKMVLHGLRETMEDMGQLPNPDTSVNNTVKTPAMSTTSGTPENNSNLSQQPNMSTNMSSLAEDLNNTINTSL